MMYYRTELLDDLMQIYEIDRLVHGKKEDKLGDVFEDYCVEILQSPTLLHKYYTDSLDQYNLDEYLFGLVLGKIDRVHSPNIEKIIATRDVEHRMTGGNSKTDVVIDIVYDDGYKRTIPISVKHTTVPKVAMAEFDVDTIVEEVGIEDERLIALLEKHQYDASAKNFSRQEKIELRERLMPHKRNFVRWVLTGSAKSDIKDLKYPELMIKIKLSKTDDVERIAVYDIDEYLNYLMYNANGTEKRGGFGTGLGWTYATGSKGKKIQFKG